MEGLDHIDRRRAAGACGESVVWLGGPAAGWRLSLGRWISFSRSNGFIEQRVACRTFCVGLRTTTLGRFSRDLGAGEAVQSAPGFGRPLVWSCELNCNGFAGSRNEMK